MPRCDACAEWITAEVTRYENGTEIANKQVLDGRGYCHALKIETPPDFSCILFMAGDNHRIITEKSGAPWNHFVMVPCPSCSGQAGCHGRCQCAGTGLVRRYDDGFLGDEQTRMHPKEKEVAASPKCLKCGFTLQREWVACPSCGTRTLAMAEPEVVSVQDSLNVR